MWGSHFESGSAHISDSQDSRMQAGKNNLAHFGLPTILQEVINVLVSWKQHPASLITFASLHFLTLLKIKCLFTKYTNVAMASG